MYFHGTCIQWSLGYSRTCDLNRLEVKSHLGVNDRLFKFLQIWGQILYYNDCKSRPIWSAKQARLVVREPPCFHTGSNKFKTWFVLLARQNKGFLSYPYLPNALCSMQFYTVKLRKLTASFVEAYSFIPCHMHLPNAILSWFLCLSRLFIMDTSTCHRGKWIMSLSIDPSS